MDRYTKLFVGAVLALVVASLATALVLRATEQPPDTSTPEGVALAYAKALQDNDAPQAWNLLATSVREKNDRDAFISRVNTDEVATLRTDDLKVSGGEARVTLVRQHAAQGLFSESYTNRSTVVLIQEPDGWRITVPPDPWVLQVRKPA
jgi:hypothetical protein